MAASEWSPALGANATLVEIEGGDAAPGRDRRRALVLASVLCLAFLSAFVGRDGPPAIPRTDVFDRNGSTLSLRIEAGDLVLYRFPDRLANEPLVPVNWMVVRVRSTQGLAVEASRPGDTTVLTWTEDGTAYWLSSPSRGVSELISIADRLR